MDAIMEPCDPTTGRVIDLADTYALDRISIRDLPATTENPFIEPRAIPIRRRTRRVTTVRGGDIAFVKVDASNGVLTVSQELERDEQEFVKLFRAGLEEAFDLTPTGRKVLQLVLRACDESPMGSDRIYLHFMEGDGPSPISRQTWLRGLKELVLKQFIAPVKDKPNLFWINPHLFFKGDRVRLVKEFIKRKNEELSRSLEKPMQTADQQQNLELAYPHG